MIKASFNRSIFYNFINTNCDYINTNEFSHIIDRNLNEFDSCRYIGIISYIAKVMKAFASLLYTSNLINFHQFGCVPYIYSGN